MSDSGWGPVPVGEGVRVLAEEVYVGTAVVPTDSGVHTMLALQFAGLFDEDNHDRGVVTIYIPAGAPEFLTRVAQVVGEHIDPASVSTVEVFEDEEERP